MKYSNGFLKLHRKILDWEWAKDTNTLCLFIKLILLANWKECKFRGHKIPRGSLVCSLQKLSDIVGISLQSVRTCIKRLKSTQEITIESTQDFNIYHIVNYDKYQVTELDTTQESTQESTLDQHSINIQSTPSKEYKKERKKEYNTLSLVSNPKTDDFEEYPPPEEIIPNLPVRAKRVKSSQTHPFTKVVIAKFVEKYQTRFGKEFPIEPMDCKNFKLIAKFLNDERHIEVALTDYFLNADHIKYTAGSRGALYWVKSRLASGMFKNLVEKKNGGFGEWNK